MHKMNSRFSTINSCSIDKSDLVFLFHLLEEKAKEALALEISFVESTPTISPDQIPQIKQRISDSFKLSISIFGSGGELLVGDEESIFNDKSFPSKVSKVIYDSSYFFRQAIGQDPMNKLVVQIDFSSQKMLDFSNPSGGPNPNQSSVSVVGINDTWVTGVFAEITSFFKGKKKRRSWLHKKNAYDLFLYLVFFPINFWIIFRISEYFRNQVPIVLTIAVCLYVFTAVLIAMRLVFNYSRWIFPLIEFSPSSPPRRTNRAVLGFIILTILAAFINDVFHGIKAYLSK